MIKDRKKYLQDNIFNTFTDSYLSNYFLNERGWTEKSVKEVNIRKNKVFDILRQWGNNEINFSESMMKKYSPRYKGRTSPFKNIGITPQLESMHSKSSSNRRYFGLSFGRSYLEFLSDAGNPANIIKSKKKPNLLVIAI